MRDCILMLLGVYIAHLICGPWDVYIHKRHANKGAEYNQTRLTWGIELYKHILCRVLHDCVEVVPVEINHKTGSLLDTPTGTCREWGG